MSLYLNLLLINLTVSNSGLKKVNLKLNLVVIKFTPLYLISPSTIVNIIVNSI